MAKQRKRHRVQCACGWSANRYVGKMPPCPACGGVVSASPLTATGGQREAAGRSGVYLALRLTQAEVDELRSITRDPRHAATQMVRATLDRRRMMLLTQGAQDAAGE